MFEQHSHTRVWQWNQNPDVIIFTSGPNAIEANPHKCRHCKRHRPHRVIYTSPGVGDIDLMFNAYTGEESAVIVTVCDNCKLPTIWTLKFDFIEGDDPDIYAVIMQNPTEELSSKVPPPHEDMPEKVEAFYKEAQSIFDRSIRGAGAIARVAFEELVDYLKAAGNNRKEKIDGLTQIGISTELVQHCRSVWTVLSEGASHKGYFNLEENENMALFIFKIINSLVLEGITQKRDSEELNKTAEKLKGLRKSAKSKKDSL